MSTLARQKHIGDMTPKQLDIWVWGTRGQPCMGIKVLEILPQNERYLVSDLEPSRHFVIKVSIAQAYKIDKIHEVSPWRSHQISRNMQLSPLKINFHWWRKKAYGWYRRLPNDPCPILKARQNVLENRYQQILFLVPHLLGNFSVRNLRCLCARLCQSLERKNLSWAEYTTKMFQDCQASEAENKKGDW